jgi:hypothetical protein
MTTLEIIEAAMQAANPSASINCTLADDATDAAIDVFVGGVDTGLSFQLGDFVGLSYVSETPEWTHTRLYAGRSLVEAITIAQNFLTERA